MKARAMMGPIFDEILNEVEKERARQDAKWGGTQHDDEHSAYDWVAYTVKHLGKAVMWGDDWRHRARAFRYQMIRVAALAVAVAEWMTRNQVDINGNWWEGIKKTGDK